MGTTTFASWKPRQSFALVLVLATGLALALAVSAKPEKLLYATYGPRVTIVNKLPYALTLYHPPGCCSIVGFRPPLPGYGCARCPHIWFKPDQVVVLPDIVKPYPLQFLLFISNGTYCMIGRHIQGEDTVTIGPNPCGLDGRGIEVRKETTPGVTGQPPHVVENFCMRLCIG